MSATWWACTSGSQTWNCQNNFILKTSFVVMLLIFLAKFVLIFFCTVARGAWKFQLCRSNMSFQGKLIFSDTDYYRRPAIQGFVSPLRGNRERTAYFYDHDELSQNFISNRYLQPSILRSSPSPQVTFLFFLSCSLIINE